MLRRSAIRNIAVFTEQSQTLANHARFKGWQLNVWHEHSDLWFLKKDGITLKDGEEPITVQCDHRIELYNVRQFKENGEGFPTDLAPAEQHTSLRTGKSYGKSFQGELQARAEALGVPESKYWLTSKQASTRGMQIKPGEMRSSTAIIARVQSKVYCAEQFSDPAKAARIPLSALSKKPWGRDVAKFLSDTIAQRGFPTGLFFTQKQLDLFQLQSEIKPGEEAVAVPTSLFGGKSGSAPAAAADSSSSGPSITGSSRLVLYSLADVENCAEVMSKLSRFPVDSPCYLGSGKPLSPAYLVKAKALLHARGHTGDALVAAKNYFLTDSEIQKRNLKLVEGAVGIDGGSAPAGGNVSFYVFNADQLQDAARSEAFRVAGTKA